MITSPDGSRNETACLTTSRSLSVDARQIDRSARIRWYPCARSYSATARKFECVGDAIGDRAGTGEVRFRQQQRATQRV